MTVPPLPRLLDASMRETARLRPTKLNVEPHGETLSTASMSLPPGEIRVPLRAWVALYTAQGFAGVYRVTGRREDVNTETRLTLKHGLCALEDFVLSGEGELTGDARAVLSAILAAQKAVFWRLGSVAGTGSIKVEYSSTNALELLEDALAQLPGYALTLDQSSFPWTLGLAALPAEDGAEARLSRNLKSVSVEEDDGELCTRVYVDDREGYTDGPTVGEYGVVERVLTVPDGATDEEVSGYVDAYLREHQRPTKTVTLDAYDLSRETGEDLDAFRLWKNARVPLPALGRTLRERITALSYPDVFGDPQSVRVTVGQKPRDLSSMLDDLRERATQTERDAANTSKAVSRNGAAIQQNITDLRDTYTELVRLGEETATRFNEVGIRLDAEHALIELKASSAEVSALGERLSQAEIDIDGANAAIDLKASRTEVDALGARVSSAEIAIDGANAQIALKVDRNGVIGAINLSPEEARIQARKIVLDGYVTASELSAQIANINKFFSGESHFSQLNVSGFANVGSLQIGQNSVHAKQIDIVTGISTRTGSAKGYGLGATAGNLGSLVTLNYITSVTPSKETVYYWSWE